MAFFTSGGDKEKLMILYSLKKAGIPLSREQITAVLSEHGCNYITISQHVIELEETACVATVPAYRLQTIVLTKRGEEVVNLFSSMLPKSLREGIDAVVAAKLDDFHRENTVQVETRSLTDGNFTTSLALVENGDAFFEIRIKLPAAKYTHIAERRWDKVSKKLYMDTLLALTTEDDPAPDIDVPEETAEE
ncbi:MAG: DUF4364 family protein [Clostridia bacterium]|nr:DUF4364 family protein [Clostridia bacterium]MBR4636549.1 DUF4364 family protein [Clostridia bacterium]